ncbi:Gfo/Idh/MocA family oxidoreductase [Devosia sp. PTR5]|uniref:Gfo/Idh/MocA family oxidoreductase n=1 Tax=Devosia oryzisoli TaxID=2774138 RepID=A0A927IU87_9HYPH|nr:Gfo/Idh/MocA family oxidoreductase [Devosia oryzisoli]
MAMPAAAASSEVRFAALLGRNGKVVDALATPYGAQAFTGCDSFLDAVDIVGIAVPPAVQPSFARAAIARGKPVLLEKPVALNVGEAERMAEDLERAGLRSAVFFPTSTCQRLPTGSNR